MRDILEIRLGDISALDLEDEPRRGQNPSRLPVPGLVSCVAGSLLFHAVLAASILIFSFGRFAPPQPRVDTVQIQLVAPTAVSEKTVPAAAIVAGSDENAATELAPEEPLETAAVVEEVAESLLQPLPLESLESLESLEPLDPVLTEKLQPVADIELPAVAESAAPTEVKDTPALEPALPSIVSIRHTIQDIESEFGADTWSRLCETAADDGVDDEGNVHECRDGSDIDYSARKQNPIYDSLNRVREPVTRSRRTAPLLASQRRSIARQLRAADIPDDVRDMVIGELNAGVNTYYGNHSAGTQNLQNLTRKDPAFALGQQIFSPAILHWMKTRKMENP